MIVMAVFLSISEPNGIPFGSKSQHYVIEGFKEGHIKPRDA